ncbi:Uncharacterized protein AUMI_12450 [Aurantimicrobium minutum]|uniref:Uncharacterized protein n=1 Tax=Aurantimicrobium minutum TaxID=708131 RepID=A0A182C1N1_9MICO|nr:Uncharacterized protein AUMI_12450 [Aurantimicrobium minutum]
MTDGDAGTLPSQFTALPEVSTVVVDLVEAETAMVAGLVSIDAVVEHPAKARTVRREPVVARVIFFMLPTLRGFPMSGL